MSSKSGTTEGFKEAYRDDFGIVLSDAEACEVKDTLTGLFSLLAKFHAEDNKRLNYDDSRGDTAGSDQTA
ncbi:MAG: hypothetical protein WD509_01805 [Candidatus Paceibacterota bacterium]